MSKKKTHVLLIISICVVIIAVFGWFVFAFVFGGPLSGIKHHSFGVVPIERPSSTLTHTFRLVNTTDHELRLTDAVPSCGCTTSDWPKEPVGAGEVLAIPVNLRLRRSQLRSSKVRLVFETGEIVVLRIDGIGRFTQPLHMAPYVPVLYPTAMQGTRAVLSLEWSDDSVHPTKPVIETPDGLRVEFDDWILSKEEDSNTVKEDTSKTTDEKNDSGTEDSKNKEEDVCIIDEIVEAVTFDFDHNKDEENVKTDAKEDET